MSQKVEQVAIALFKNDQRWKSYDWLEVREGLRDIFRSDARIAIEAMREPTEEMLSAGAEGCGEDSEDTASGAWTSMIDAALAEEQA